MICQVCEIIIKSYDNLNWPEHFIAHVSWSQDWSGKGDDFYIIYVDKRGKAAYEVQRKLTFNHLIT